MLAHSVKKKMKIVACENACAHTYTEQKERKW